MLAFGIYQDRAGYFFRFYKPLDTITTDSPLNARSVILYVMEEHNRVLKVAGDLFEDLKRKRIKEGDLPKVLQGYIN